MGRRGRGGGREVGGVGKGGGARGEWGDDAVVG